MQLGMIGLGRMGASLVRRLTKHGHKCVDYDVSTAAVKRVAGRVLSAMRKQFGGHEEKKGGK